MTQSAPSGKSACGFAAIMVRSAAIQGEESPPGKTHFASTFNAQRYAPPPWRIFSLSLFRKSCIMPASRLVERGVARDRHDT
jgi:hypothetical protein